MGLRASTTTDRWKKFFTPVGWIQRPIHRYSMPESSGAGMRLGRTTVVRMRTGTSPAVRSSSWARIWSGVGLPGRWSYAENHRVVKPSGEVNCTLNLSADRLVDQSGGYMNHPVLTHTVFPS